MTDPVVGFAVRREANEPAPASPAQMSIIGLCMPAAAAAGVAGEAFTEAFPLNEPVFFSSTSTKAAMIAPESRAGKALTLINAQLARMQAAAQVVFVRVAAGVDDDATIANIAGNAAAKTGVHAFLTAGAKVGAIPRLIGAPGYTHQRASTGGEVDVSRAAKAGGNTGGGTMTLATPAYNAGVKDGVYVVRCVGGGLAATVVADGDNAGDGTLGSLTVDPGAKKGAWSVACVAEDADGGLFVVTDPDGVYAGTAAVGVAFSQGTGINFTISDGADDFDAGDAFTITVADAVPANGGVFSVTDPDGTTLANATVGALYDGPVRFTIADVGTDFAIGDGFDVTVAITGATAEANPVAAALPAVLNALLAIAVVDTGGADRDADIAARETLSSERIMPATPAIRMLDPDASVAVESMASAVALGLFVRRDFENEGRPFRSVMNQPVYGIVGPARAIDFSLVDGSSEGQDLLAHQVGCIVRGESGNDFSISDGGFVFMGFEGTGAETIWRQIHKVRGRDFVELTAIRTLRQYLGRYTLTTQTIQAIVNTVSTILAKAEARGEILGYQCRFDPDENNEQDLRTGAIFIDARFEEAPVFRKATLLSRPYSTALTATINELLARTSLIVG